MYTGRKTEKGMFFGALTSKLKENRTFSFQNLVMIVVILLLGIIASVISPNFLKVNNLINVLQQISVTGIVALGAGMVLISRGVDLSVGMMVSFVACFCAWLYTHYHVEIGLMVAIGMCLAIFCGFVNGIIISRTKAEPFIVTLGMMSIYQGLALLVSNADNISLQGAFSELGTYRIPVINLPISVLIFLFVFVLLFVMMKYTKFGRRVYAMGGNEEAAVLAGINVKNYKLAIYLINGAIVGLAALILLSRLGSANATVGTGIELQAIAAAVVGGVSLGGGKGNILGALFGIVLLGLISNSLNLLRIPAFYQYIVLGVIIVGAIVLSSYEKKK